MDSHAAARNDATMKLPDPRLARRAVVALLVLASFRPATPAGAAEPPPGVPAPSPVAGPVTLIVTNARLFDGREARLRERVDIAIAGNRITAIRPAGTTPVPAVQPGLRIIDAGGRIAIPGLIDAHIHPGVTVGLSQVRDSDANYIAIRSTVEARKMLLRGFTTVRDMGGPTFGLKQAIDEGAIEGPRIFPSGAIVSQTSGHADFRARTQPSPRLSGVEDPAERLGFGVVADGPDAVLTAVREQLRQGATQIKLAAGGGISSMYDPIDSVQYVEEELRAAVRAAADWGTYVAVHAYTPAAIRRSVEAGVRSIEHAHLIDETTMKLIAERGAFLSPQAYVFSGAFSPTGAGTSGQAAGPAPPAPPPTPAQAAQRAKSRLVSAGLDRMMQLAKKHGVRIAFGTDVFGGERVFAMESREFAARMRWFSSLEILRQATSINGELVALSGPRYGYPGKVGVLEEGAMADLLLVEGDPLEDVALLGDPERSLVLIVKDGRVVRSKLSSSQVELAGARPAP
jgi:imidazolonepropionase-like amidohydrolase